MTDSLSESFQVFSPLYGFMLRDGIPYLDYGDFTICNKEHLNSNYPEVIDTFNPRYELGQGKVAQIDFYFVIQNNIRASSIQEATQIFEGSIEHLINTFLYCIPVLNSENHKISTRDVRTNQNTFVRSSSGSHESHSSFDLISPLYILDDKILTYPGNDSRLFEFIVKQPSSNIQFRIKRSVNWIGEALRNTDSTEGFLWLGIALETLLIHQKGFVTKSITAQLAEYAAFLTESNVDKRKAINKRVKELYDKRSAIVHSFSNNVEQRDIADLVLILKGIINTLFRLIDEKGATKIEDIETYVENKRFS